MNDPELLHGRMPVEPELDASEAALLKRLSDPNHCCACVAVWMAEERVIRDERADLLLLFGSIWGHAQVMTTADTPQLCAKHQEMSDNVAQAIFGPEREWRGTIRLTVAK